MFTACVTCLSEGDNAAYNINGIVMLKSQKYKSLIGEPTGKRAVFVFRVLFCRMSRFSGSKKRGGKHLTITESKPLIQFI